MDSRLTAILIASFSACLVTSLGIGVISYFEEWGKKNSGYFVSFAAGILITVSFTHIIPRAIKFLDSAPFYLLGGFLAFFFLNRFLHMYLCKNSEFADAGESAVIGLLPMLAIGLHSLIDGVIFSVTFHVDIFTGFVAAIGMILHEFPEGIVTFVLLERGGFSRRKAAVIAFIAAAASTPLGSLLSYPFVRRIGVEALGGLLGIAAGALAYVGATHLLPHTEKEEVPYGLWTFVGGVALALSVVVMHHLP